ncbi:MAG: glycoside hydrolase family 9 protein [Armatimonadetes bacterium]|nr:glycoside hydrolase family 9 protein [Armatimonadota bacterium]
MPLLPFLLALLAAAPESPQIIVDQLGWRPGDVKIVVFADPQKGQNKDQHYQPGPSFEVRAVPGGAVAFRGAVVQWKAGTVDTVSGDRCWQGTFTALAAPGRYVVYDPATDRQSAPFWIDDHVYAGVMRAALRTFYYQRCGSAIEAKFGGNWTRPACHLGQKQARMLRAGKLEGEPRDVSGGWHDAGDHNKYVPFLNSTLWDLMSAYELNPKAFGDDVGIPESGNGVPDLLDELRYEFDWLLRMQLPDGSVCNRVTTTSYDTGDGPHNDRQVYSVTPPTTWATSTFAASCAHAARLWKGDPYGARLAQAAAAAWAYLANGWVDPLGANELTQAFVTYAGAPGHDPAIVADFAKSLSASLAQHYVGALPDDPYRAPIFEGHYCWGSNSVKSKWGHLPLFARQFGLDPARSAVWDELAQGYVHYLHGRNPLSLCYLTNLGERGAALGVTRSVMEMYHGWFHDGSPLYDGPKSQFGPAPGFLVGGPNQFFGKAWVAPPAGEPPAKAFREWNTGWNAQHNDNEDSWAITEPAIYYQAAYVLLLAGCM